MLPGTFRNSSEPASFEVPGQQPCPSFSIDILIGLRNSICRAYNRYLYGFCVRSTITQAFFVRYQYALTESKGLP